MPIIVVPCLLGTALNEGLHLRSAGMRIDPARRATDDRPALPHPARRSTMARATSTTASAMARQAEHDGIEAVCATPHIRHDHDVRIEELAGRVEAVNTRLGRRGSRSRSSRAARWPRPRSRASARRSWRGSRSESAAGSCSSRRRARSATALIAPRRPPRRARPPGADRPPRAPPLRRHVRAHGGARRRGRADPGHRRLLPPRRDGRRDAEDGAEPAWSTSSAATPTPRSAAGRYASARPSSAWARSPSCAPQIEWMAETAPRAIVEGEQIEPPFAPSL